MPTTDALRKVIIPEVSFRQAAMSDVVKDLSYCGPGCLCHSGLHASQDIREHEVVYRMRLCGHDAHDEKSPECTRQPNECVPFVRLGPEVSLTTNKISTYDLIVLVAEQTSARLEVQPDSMILRTPKVVLPPEQDPF